MRDEAEGVLLARARDGDGAAFAALTEPHRRELRVHCYRMLGSATEAEDVVQDTLLAAWQGLRGFEGRASVRTWLYRIATNRCLNARRAAARRPPSGWDVPGVEPPEPSRLGEVPWLEPLPDTAGLAGPEAHHERRETVSLAFVTALQRLPPRQVAVLVLRDVLAFRADEVADMLGSTTESVKSALKRARAGLATQWSADVEPPPTPGSPAEEAVVARFVRAWEAADVASLVTLLTDDVFVSMPPMPFEYEGRELVARFCAALFDGGRRFHLVRTAANGQPALAAYLRGGARPAAGLFVLRLRGARIAAMTRFEASVLPAFGLPGSLPDLPAAASVPHRP